MFSILDQGASHHAAKWGCTWNKNIMELVKESDLEVINQQRWHFGTTYVLECKPKLKTKMQVSSES
jgi:methyltransferase OMS1, mitochondrial